MKSLLVYHQCFKNRNATKFAVKNFRNHNPNIPYYLLSDGGGDFSDIAKEYNLNWVYNEENVDVNNLSSKKAKIIVERILKCFQHSQCNYMLLMEDDIYCRGKIEIENDFDLAGAYTPGNIIAEEAMNYIKQKYNITPNVNWYNACGGSILNKNIFFENYDLIQKFLDEDYDFIIENLSGEKFKWSFGSMDSLLNFLYMICGKEIRVNSDLTEYFRNPNWESSEHKLVHQYKKYYE